MLQLSEEREKSVQLENEILAYKEELKNCFKIIIDLKNESENNSSSS